MRLSSGVAAGASVAGDTAAGADDPGESFWATAMPVRRKHPRSIDTSRLAYPAMVVRMPAAGFGFRASRQFFSGFGTLHAVPLEKAQWEVRLPFLGNGPLAPMR